MSEIKKKVTSQNLKIIYLSRIFFMIREAPVRKFEGFKVKEYVWEVRVVKT